MRETVAERTRRCQVAGIGAEGRVYKARTVDSSEVGKGQHMGYGWEPGKGTSPCL